LDKSGLKPEAIDKLTAPVLTSKIGSVGVSVRTAGSLTALVEFLHKFYSSAQLHQITRLDLTPSGNNLTIKLQVEALMLPGAVETDALPKETVNPFKLADLSAYRVAIGGRDIFKPYTRPTAIADRGSTPPVEGEVDAARFAFFSGATLGTKGMLAWINVRTTGETILASEGDPVNVGQLKSKVLSIEQRSMVFETDGKKMQVEIGKSLRDAKQIGTVTTEKADNEAAASGS
jgi:hypothetical protein